MKDLTTANKKRWIAGGLYGLLSVYQLFLTKFLMEQATLTNVYFVMLYAIGLVVVAAGMCMWMFHGRQEISGGGKRVVVAGTIFAIIFELMTYKNQTDIINYTLYTLFPDMADNTTVLYVLMVLRLLLLILAAFCVVSTSMEPKELALEEATPDSDADADKAISANDEHAAETTAVLAEVPAEIKEIAEDAKDADTDGDA